MPDFVIGQGDTAPPLTRTMLDDQQAPVNIQGATIAFTMTPIRGGTAAYDGAALNLQSGDGSDGSRGKIAFGQGATPWTTAITGTDGDYLARFRATYADGRVEWFPNEGYMLVTITPKTPDTASGMYLGVEELKKSVGMDQTSKGDQDVTRALRAASRAIDNYCRRRFTKTAAGTSRKLGPAYGADWLEIPDLVTLESSTFDGATVANDGLSYYFERWPTEENAPYCVMRRVSGGTWMTPLAGQNVTLVGAWGWATVPDPVVMACQVIASRLVKRGREAPFGILPFGDQGEAMRITQADPDIRFLLDPYKRSQRR